MNSLKRCSQFKKINILQRINACPISLDLILFPEDNDTVLYELICPQVILLQE